MATLTIQDINTAGATPTYVAAAAGGDQFANDGKTMFQMKNTGAQITATFVAQVACNQGTIHSSAVILPATTGDKMVGPFDPARYNDGNGNVQVTYSAVTGVTVAALSL